VPSGPPPSASAQSSRAGFAPQRAADAGSNAFHAGGNAADAHATATIAPRMPPRRCYFVALAMNTVYSIPITTTALAAYATIDT
jgi:hypothetical protein